MSVINADVIVMKTMFSSINVQFDAILYLLSIAKLTFLLDYQRLICCCLIFLHPPNKYVKGDYNKHKVLKLF